MLKTFLFQAIQFSQTVLIQKIQFSISMQFSSIQPIDRSLSGATIPSQSRPGSNGNEGVLHHHRSLTIGSFSVIYRTLVGEGLTPLQRCSRSILRSYICWVLLDINYIYIYIYIYILFQSHLKNETKTTVPPTKISSSNDYIYIYIYMKVAEKHNPNWWIYHDVKSTLTFRFQ